MMVGYENISFNFCKFKSMSYVCAIRNNAMNNSQKFDDNLQELARFARVISHPARLAILQYLAETKTCISGDISEVIPLSRTTVSQHLKELRELGLIHGDIDGLKINYCLCGTELTRFKELFTSFFKEIGSSDIDCKC
ncbi:MAG: metalloregulator ArsR/SmtB family transcription factor [Bacteroidetes bacterium]|nr:metalloregulator ArsR/SmtB family transcription factor [Bacteroidota bacterium]